MRLLVGLGNPGSRYEGTRHNVGFDALERFLSASGGRWNTSTHEEVSADVVVDGKRVTLLRPLTFMNASGGPVTRFVETHALAPSNVLVVYDDVALPLGTLRLRERGSSGGHNGLGSILDALGTTDVPRLRIGIKPAATTDTARRLVDDVPSEDLVDFVLSPFLAEERPIVHEVLDRVVAATRVVLNEGMVQAMSRFNGDSDRAARRRGEACETS